MIVKVYHVKDPRFFDDKSSDTTASDLHLVAEVDVPAALSRETALGYVFRRTNTIDSPWWENEGVRFLGSPTHGMDGCRSTSVGDVIEVDGVNYIVAMFGFRSIVLK